MLSKEQFEYITSDMRKAMEDYGVRVKVLNSFNGTDMYSEEVDTCRCYMVITNTLADALMEYAKGNSDLLTVIERTKGIVRNERWGQDVKQGNTYNMEEYEHYYDGIFDYYFRGSKLKEIYFSFDSMGFGNCYTRHFMIEVVESEELGWKIEINQSKPKTIYEFDKEVGKPFIRGCRRLK